MRIEVLIVDGAGPVYEAVLRLGDVTVLTGRNDSGKTRVLRAIESGLMSLPDAEWLEVHGIASPEEVRAFLIDPQMPSTGMVEAVSEAVAPFGAAVEAPEDHHGLRVGVLAPETGELLHGWRYGRALGDLDEPTRAAVVQALGNAVFAEPDPDEPLKLEALGGVDPQILPETIIVPCTDAELGLRVVGAIIGLARALRGLAGVWRGVQDVTGPLADGPPLEWNHHAPAVESSELAWEWLVLEDDDVDPGVSRVHPAAVLACDALSRSVAGLLPDFISTDYWLRVAPARPTDIARGGCIHIQLQRREPLSEPAGSFDVPDPYRWFDVSEVATGFLVWIQLALCEAAHRLQRCTYLLQQHIHEVLWISHQGQDRTSGVTYAAEEVIDGIKLEGTEERDEIVAHRLDGLGTEMQQAALEDLLEWLTDPRQPLPAIPQQPIFEPPDEDELFFVDVAGAVLEPLPRDRLYLLDEPEQRLHPMLQRQAARWLSTLMGQWGAQCVLATHSVAFMSLSGDTYVYEITRGGHEATVLPLNPTSLSPYSQLAREMGLDRGELLSRARAFVITTGPVAALLQEFHSERLAAAQITLLTVQEGAGAPEFLSRALLTRVTAAPLGVLLTSISPTEIEELQAAEARQRARTAARGAEAETAALLLDDSTRHGHHVELLTLDTPTVFDLLDQDTIAKCVTGPEPFPGHDAAHERHAGTDHTYLQFLSAAYGLHVSDEPLRAITRRMRDSGLPAPAALTDAVWRVEQLALASEAPIPATRGS